MSRKKDNPFIEAKNQSMADKSNESRNSVTGYMETGNDAQIQAKARALRNNNNRSTGETEMSKNF